jgi:hypothetical protein
MLKVSLEDLQTELGPELARRGLALHSAAVLKTISLSLFCGDNLCLVAGVDFHDLCMYFYFLRDSSSFPSFNGMLAQAVTLEQAIERSCPVGWQADLKIVRRKTNPYKSEDLRARLREVLPVLVKYLPAAVRTLNPPGAEA